MRTSKKLVSRFDAACVRAVSSKKQHAKTFYFRLLGYIAEHAPRVKVSDICLGGDWENFTSFAVIVPLAGNELLREMKRKRWITCSCLKRLARYTKSF